MSNHSSEIRRINLLATELNSLYHLSSLKLGITDSVSVVLYSIYNNGGECLLSDIYKESGISKQTIGSAVRSLEENGILFLKQYNGKSKKLALTDKGKEYVKETAEKLYKAESDAFNTWTEDEIHTHINLMKKYVDCFRSQIERM